tara:strand:- start:38 stop:193 length:156 start_codon:yes stop_codon:yes gene_type:complete
VRRRKIPFEWTSDTPEYIFQHEDTILLNFNVKINDYRRNISVLNMVENEKG